MATILNIFFGLSAKSFQEEFDFEFLNINITFWKKNWHLKKKLINNTFLYKLYPKHPLQALSPTSFLYNKHSLLVMLFYNLFILQLSMARWR